MNTPYTNRKRNMTNTYSFQNRGGDISHEIEALQKYITAHNCKKLNIDISSLNFIDATKVCILCSTFHFAKYIDGKIRWLVKDELVKSQIRPMKLNNVEIETRGRTIIRKLSPKALRA